MGPPHTGTEYMVLRLLLKRSVASMNRLSMGVFWERRSFICKKRLSLSLRLHTPSSSSAGQCQGLQTTQPQARYSIGQAPCWPPTTWPVVSLLAIVRSNVPPRSGAGGWGEKSEGTVSVRSKFCFL